MGTGKSGRFGGGGGGLRFTGVPLFLCALLTLWPVPSAFAAALAGVTMPDAVEVGGKSLPLVGLGLHSKAIVETPGFLGLPKISGPSVKVYVVALYMEKPTRDAASVVSADSPKAIVVEFVYSEVSAEQLQKAWSDGFTDNTPDPKAALKSRMDRFVALFDAPAKRGDRAVMAYLPGIGTTVTLAGREAAVIPGADFASVLFAIWFGDDPADAGLKASVLK
jgi:hypothetical protein